MKPFIKSVYIFSTLALLLFSCSGDDDGGANQPPGDFNLIGVTNGAIEVGLLPTFSWENATDPEDEEVTYTLLLDTHENPQTIVSENIGDTSFNLVDRLLVLTQYYWRVEAIDSNGNRTSSNTYSFTTRNLNFSDNLVVENTAFSARRQHASVVFDNKMWVIGGYDSFSSEGLKNDVWYSDDGANWTLAITNAPFSSRSGHTAVVFDNKIWVIGGVEEAAINKNDVWFSADGVNWSLATNTAPFSARHEHTSVIFDDKLWVIGGLSDNGFERDVWYSTDGVTWVPATQEASFSGRYRHSSVVFDDKIWVVSGSEISIFNDVWYSTDGTSWTLFTEDFPFLGREMHSSVVFDNKLWIIAGRGTTEGNPAISRRNDMHYSLDGTTWNTATDNAPFSARVWHTSLVFDQKIWVIGGYDGDFKNDVWAFD